MKMTTELLERAKQYNANLKKIESEASEIRGKISYGIDDLTRRCQELTQILGIQVTEDNLEELWQSEMQKVLNNLEIGETVLKQIREAQAYDTDLANAQENKLNTVQAAIAQPVDSGLVRVNAPQPTQPTMTTETPIISL